MKINKLIEVSRIKNPIGIEFLFMPCLIGVLFAYLNNNLHVNFFEILRFAFLFFIGSTCLRSFGCIFNDYIDKDIDKMVERTKERPFANRSIKITDVIFLALFLLALALLVLINMPKSSYKVCIIGFIMSLIYPFMKRITNYPQVFLGFTFNIGIFIGYLCIKENIGIEIVYIYLGCVFLTVAYDTIYAFMDLEDDKKINVGSMAIIIQNSPKFWISVFYTGSMIMFIFAGLPLFDTVCIYLLAYLNTKKWNFHCSKSCFDLFIFNKWIFRNVILIILLEIIISNYFKDNALIKFFR